MNVLEKYDPDLRKSMALLHKARDSTALSQPQDVASLRANTEPMRLRLQAMPSSKQVEAQLFTIKTSDGFDLEMIWYQPLNRASDLHSSAVLHIHGGGLITYDVHTYRAIVSDLVARSQIPMLSVNYRLAPEHPFPTPLEDCWTALLWLQRHSEQLRFDQSRIQVYGDSAGGGLAAALSILARDRCLTPPLAKQVLIYPMLDDRTSMQATNIDLSPLVTHSWDANYTCWSAYLGVNVVGTDQVPKYAVPARTSDLSGLPPTYIDVGDLDIFLDEAIRYVQRLQEAGVATTINIFPGVPHAFEIFAPEARVSQRAVEERVRALQGT